MVNSKVVFNVLYSFITFGSGRPDIDSPDSYFRLSHYSTYGSVSLPKLPLSSSPCDLAKKPY